MFRLPELDRLPVASKKSGDMDETPPELCNVFEYNNQQTQDKQCNLYGNFFFRFLQQKINNNFHIVHNTVHIFMDICVCVNRIYEKQK